MFRNFEFKTKYFLSQVSNDVGVLCDVVRHTELVWLDLYNRNELMLFTDFLADFIRCLLLVHL